jgi:hypothetical protein
MIDTFQYAICCLILTLPALIAIQFVYAPAKKKPEPEPELGFVTGHGWFAKELSEILGIDPSQTTAIEIIVDTEHAVQVDVTQLLNGKQAQRVLYLLRKCQPAEVQWKEESSLSN